MEGLCIFIFFLFLSFAALSTVIAVFENIVAFAMDLWNVSRVKAVLINIVLIAVLSMPCILGFNVLADITPLGPGTNIMDLEDFLVSNNLLPLGSLVYLLFCTRKNGWGFDNFVAEANSGNGIKLSRKLKFYMSYILPVIIVIIYLKGYYDMFSPKGIKYLIPWMMVAFAMLGLIAYFAFSKGKEEVNE
jgi:NSS family neurotransmitter:Na+ symporter